LAGFSIGLPFKWHIASDTFSIDFIWGWFGAFAILSVFIPNVSFFTSQFAGPFCGAPHKWFEALNAFASQIDWEGIGANAFVLSIVPDVIHRTFVSLLRSFCFFTFMGVRVKLGASWTSNTVFFVKIKDWSWILTGDAFRIGAS
jgi:hypothetical protein